MNEAASIASKTGHQRRSRKDSDALRRCLVTGEMKPRSDMIRFVIGPDNAVVPDLAENLPGTGLWVSASYAAVEQAAKKNLFAKAAQNPAKPAVELASLATDLLRRRCLNLLGMAKGAGAATLGETQTEAALRTRSLVFYARACDAARALDNRHAVPEYTMFTRDELGAAFGFDHIVYVGLMPHGLTDKLKRELTRFVSMLERSE